jgi:hypothetical protein
METPKDASVPDSEDEGCFDPFREVHALELTTLIQLEVSQEN